jgi:site-specific recombinase XerD
LAQLGERRFSQQGCEVLTHSCKAEEAVSAFLGYLRRRGHPIGTQRQYGRYLKLFAQWAGDQELDAITARDIELGYLGQWHDEWERTQGRAPSENTKRNHIQALRALYKFLERFDFLNAPNPMTKIEAPKVKRRGVKPWLRPDEDDALLAAHTNVREQIVIWFLRFTGVRWGEAMALRQKDVDLAAGSISVAHSKTDNGIRQLPILPELRPAIVRWFAYRERIRRRGRARSARTQTARTALWRGFARGHLATLARRALPKRRRWRRYYRRHRRSFRGGRQSGAGRSDQA